VVCEAPTYLMDSIRGRSPLASTAVQDRFPAEGYGNGECMRFALLSQEGSLTCFDTSSVLDSTALATDVPGQRGGCGDAKVCYYPWDPLREPAALTQELPGSRWLIQHSAHRRREMQASPCDT
jgi:hypothetical protein